MNKHMYLFAATVTFQATEDSAATTVVSTVVPCEEQKVTVRELAQAQQGVQMTLFGKLGGEVPVLDVVVTSVSYLGEMTQDEFTHNAEGPVLVADNDEPGTVQ